MGKIKGCIFDKNGNRIESDNIEIFVSEMSDKLLVEVYKSTIYQHQLTIEIEILVKKGLIIIENEISIYDPTLTVTSINVMKDELIERFNKNFHDKVIKTIDLSFLDKKPKNI
tara:strand:+ start:651 stop:989 length:339 start_codon:yes stop_codon:yes gene_type:complete